MLKQKSDVKKTCQVNVYLCDQNRSLCSLKGSLKQRHLSAKSTEKSHEEYQENEPKKTSSLEKLKLNAQQLSSLSPSKSLLSSNNLSPWCSLKDLNVISSSNLSINNNYDSTSRDCLDSINNLDTVSPRVSSNSLTSLHLDFLDLNEPPTDLPVIESFSNVQLPVLQHASNFSYPQPSQLYGANRCRSVGKFSRSTSCPHVIPPMQLKDFQIAPKGEVKLNLDQNEPILGKISPAPPDNTKPPQRPVTLAERQEAMKECSLRKELSKDGERKKRSMMACKSLARSKCMQWLNSLDEGD